MFTADSPLRRLFRRPLFIRWAVANLFARLPLTMTLLALILLGEQVSGSLATGALLAGITTTSSGLAAQWRGRRLDRGDLRAGLRRDLLVSAGVIASMSAAAALGAPVWALAIMAGVHGVVSAAVLGGFRTVMVLCVPESDIEPANAIDAVFVEVAFIAGPALAGTLGLFVDATGILLVMSGAFLVGAWLLGFLPTRRPVDDRTPPGPAPLFTRGATPVYLLVFGVGLFLGGWEASIPARIEAFGMDPASAGPLLALTALGSGLAGVAATNLQDPLRYGRLFGAALLVSFGLLFLPTAATTTPVLLGVALLLFGMPIAPMNALAGLAFQRTVAVPRQAEGFSLYPAMILIGAGLGQATSGLLLEMMTPQRLISLLAVGPIVLGTVVFAAAVRRRVLGLPPGVGYGHDPTIANPAGYAGVSINVAPN